MITKIDLDIDYNKIIDTYNSLNIDHLLQSNLKQVALQCRKGCPSDIQLYESCGSLFYDWVEYDKNPNGKLPLRKKIYKQEDFTELCNIYKNTYFKTVVETINQQYNITRGRFMLMEHKTCLTYHTDQSPRIHIPIYTNENCMMIINDQVVRLPFGNTYLVNTRLQHTAINASKYARVHLVFCIS